MRFLGSLDLMGFANSLTDIQQGNNFGFLEIETSKIPLIFSLDLIYANDLSHLLLKDNGRTKINKPLAHLTNHSIQTIPNKIYRDNLESDDFVIMKQKSRRGSFKNDITQNYIEVKPTHWTAYLLQQFSEFQKFYLIGLLFISFVVTIYLNSFIHSLLVLLFAFAISGFVFLPRSIFPQAFHADCLWLLYFCNLHCSISNSHSCQNYRH